MWLGFAVPVFRYELHAAPRALQKAKDILIRELGPVYCARFIQQYEEGAGNYTSDRHQGLGDECALPFACPGIAITTPGALPEPLDTCLPSIEEIEAELGWIGEEM